jgi:hypothetical protein
VAVVFCGNPDNLDMLARTVSALADRARGHALWLRQHTAAMTWQSSGADAFRRQIDNSAETLLHGAGGLDDAAAALRTHGQTVRYRMDEIARIESAVTRWLANVSGSAARASFLAHHELPPTGSHDWLAIEETLRRLGISW